MDAADLQTLLELGKEGRAVEFKSSTPWAHYDFKAKITKAILAFANVRDGGRIVIGVDQDSDGSFEFSGMKSDDLSTWSYDDVCSFVSEYADPFVDISMDRAQMNGKTFLIISISEFAELPVLCKRDGAAKLRRGAIYTRTYRMPESAEVPSQTELREILDLAVEKRLRKFLKTAVHVGLAVAPGPSATELFTKQLEGF